MNDRGFRLETELLQICAELGKVGIESWAHFFHSRCGEGVGVQIQRNETQNGVT